MSLKGKIYQGRYALLTLAVLTCIGTPTICAADAKTERSSDVSTKDIHVEVDFEKEMLKEAPETKTIITREDLDRKGARTLSPSAVSSISSQRSHTSSVSA